MGGMRLYVIAWGIMLVALLGGFWLRKQIVFNKPRIIHQQISDLGYPLWVYEKAGYRCLTFSSDQSVNDSCMRISNPSECVHAYTKLIMKAWSISKRKPKNVLLLGLGGGDLVRNARFQMGKSFTVDAVEIDQAVIDVAAKYFEVKSDSQVSIIHDDALAFLQKPQLPRHHANTTYGYDFIIVDIFKQDVIDEMVFNKAFALAVKSRLSDHGWVAINTFDRDLTNYDFDSVLKSCFDQVSSLIVGGNRIWFAK